MSYLLIDGNSIICRYYFANNGDAFSLFTQLILNNYKKYKNIVIAFDRCSSNFRKTIDITYKQNRPTMDPLLREQLLQCELFCQSVGIVTLSHINFEADDLIASCSYYLSLKEKNIHVMSTDKDLLQLVSENVKIYNPFKKIYFDNQKVFDFLGIYPENVALFLALCGDSSDNIKGIVGIGPKKAIHIINVIGINNVYKDNFYKKYDFSPLSHMLSLTQLRYDIPININIEESFCQQFLDSLDCRS